MQFITPNRTVNKFNLDLHLYIWHKCHEMSHMWQHANNLWLTNIPFIDIFSLFLSVLRFIILEPVNLYTKHLNCNSKSHMTFVWLPIYCFEPWVNVNPNKTERVHQIIVFFVFYIRPYLSVIDLESGRSIVVKFVHFDLDN